MSRKGQVTIFVIVALVIVAGILLFLAFRGNLFVEKIPAEYQPIYSLYSECLEVETRNALSILGTQGGRIDAGEFAPGSDFAPFSSHLNFLGFPVPYWYYVSGNNFVKENVPSRTDMEREIENYLERRVNNNCNFDEFYSQGFYIDMEDFPVADVKIEDEIVKVSINSDVVASRGGSSAKKSEHEIEVISKIGKFHSLAVDVYNKEKKDSFLEEYAVDVLRLYAPVDGTEISCAPQIWNTREVVDELKKGLEANIGSIKFEGDYYRLNDPKKEYFVVDLNVNEAVSLMYSKNWPSKIEVSGDRVDDDVMIAEPAGNQEGLGILGFCYVPYHFVYDVSFPVMVQFSDGFDVFQFPVVVVIDNNVAREAVLQDSTGDESEFELCEFAEGDVKVYTFDNELNSIESDVSYKCFDEVCRLGKGKVVDAKIPLCLNGYLIANADGFAEKVQLYSSNSETSAEIFLNREYELNVELTSGGSGFGSSTAVVHFKSEETGKTVSAVFPDKKYVRLSEGNYEVSAYVYGDSSIVVPASTRIECAKVLKSGVLGVFGATKEECFDIEIPASKIEYALVGGGTTSSYFLESQLKRGNIKVDVGRLPSPTSMEQLQYNHASFDSLGVDLNFHEK